MLAAPPVISAISASAREHSDAARKPVSYTSRSILDARLLRRRKPLSTNARRWQKSPASVGQISDLRTQVAKLAPRLRPVPNAFV